MRCLGSPTLTLLLSQCRTSNCDWSSGDLTPALFAEPSDLNGSHPMGTVSLRRGSVVNYMRVLSWTHDTIVAEVPEGVGAGYDLVVSVRLSPAAACLHC